MHGCLGLHEVDLPSLLTLHTIFSNVYGTHGGSDCKLRSLAEGRMLVHGLEGNHGMNGGWDCL